MCCRRNSGGDETVTGAVFAGSNCPRAVKVTSQDEAPAGMPASIPPVARRVTNTAAETATRPTAVTRASRERDMDPLPWRRNADQPTTQPRLSEQKQMRCRPPLQIPAEGALIH